MQQKVQVPSQEQLTQAVTQMLLQRGQLKDQLEQLEKQLPVLQGQLQLLLAQEQAAKEAVVDKD
jgi:hypothetical protein